MDKNIQGFKWFYKSGIDYKKVKTKWTKDKKRDYKTKKSQR